MLDKSWRTFQGGLSADSKLSHIRQKTEAFICFNYPWHLARVARRLFLFVDYKSSALRLVCSAGETQVSRGRIWCSHQQPSSTTAAYRVRPTSFSTYPELWITFCTALNAVKAKLHRVGWSLDCLMCGAVWVGHGYAARLCSLRAPIWIRSHAARSAVTGE